VCPETAQGRISGFAAAGKPPKIALEIMHRRMKEGIFDFEEVFSAAC